MSRKVLLMFGRQNVFHASCPISAHLSFTPFSFILNRKIHEGRCTKTLIKPQIRQHATKGGSSKEGELNAIQNNYDMEFGVEGKGTKVVSANIEFLRVDLVLKAGLGISRNKAEKAFYQSRIRVNGKKILKKSVLVHEGDEVDLVRGVSPMNPDFLTISRVEVLDVTDDEDSYNVKLRRTKSLTVENYEDTWKPPTE